MMYGLTIFDLIGVASASSTMEGVSATGSLVLDQWCRLFFGRNKRIRGGKSGGETKMACEDFVSLFIRFAKPRYLDTRDNSP